MLHDDEDQVTSSKMPIGQVVMNLEIKDSKELFPGVMVYKTDKQQNIELVETIKEYLQCFWAEAGVYDPVHKSRVDKEVRSCYNYFLIPQIVKCGMQDPLAQMYVTFEECFSRVMADFEVRYDINRLTSDPINILKYEVGGRFKKHLDDSCSTPRTVSLSMVLNDDYDGGEFEFNRFKVKIEPNAGDIIVFCSSFPYQHEVHEVTKGTRYSAVKWYRFDRR